MPGPRAPTFRHFAMPAVAGAIGLLLVAAAPTPTPPNPSPTPAAGAAAEPPAIARTDLQRHDLGMAGHEAIQARVDFSPGALAPRHTHPGEEIVYVLRGSLEYRVQGRPPVTLEAGDVLFIPAGAIHAVRNVGSGPASELATYIVETGRPLITLVR
jgi:quercetin dioxygenase-like cupin family protein